ncbi:MAG TPA: protein adenylyltransferase SelO family protein, partial [Rubricoccaceae bacterium]
DAAQPYVALLEAVTHRTATLMADWQAVGFCHGVMNTDNMSILGLTIDYGPYGWLDDYDPEWTPNTTDAGGRRYRFGHQPGIAQWNLVRLAEAVLPLFPAAAPLHAGLNRYLDVFTEEHEATTTAKFGLAPGEATQALVEEGYSFLHAAEMDHTLFFRALGDLAGSEDGANEADDATLVGRLGDVFYDDAKRDAHTPAIADWLRRWHAAASASGEPAEVRRARMHAVNPRYILRNYLAQQAIDAAEGGDPSLVHTLLDLVRRPYDEQPEHAAFAAQRPEWARNRAGSSMLSCSS